MAKKFEGIVLSKNHGSASSDLVDKWSAQMELNTKRESANFKRLLPELISKQAGHYVAISGGKVVASDKNELALAEKIARDYEKTFVLIGRVPSSLPSQAQA